MSFAGSFHLVQDSIGEFVKKPGTPDVEIDEHPGHDELGDRREIGNVDVANYVRLRYRWEVANENKEAKVVDEEKDGGGKNEVTFLAYKLAKVA